jgi:hypothetical protein
MAILNYVSSFVGETNVYPRLARLICNDSYATVIEPGYIGLTALQGNPLSASDYVFVSYGTDANTHGIFTPSISNGVVTLAPYIGAGSVLLPVVANHIAVFTDTAGQIGDPTGTVAHLGNIQAGSLAGDVGGFYSFAATPNRGYLSLQANANSGNFGVAIRNLSFGQSTTMEIPDPGVATANFAVVPAALVNANLISASGTAGKVADSGIAVSNVQLKTQVLSNTVANGGGSASFSIAVSGVTASSIAVCNFKTQANAASILTAECGSNVINIVASADPGACSVSYVAYVVAQ